MTSKDSNAYLKFLFLKQILLKLKTEDKWCGNLILDIQDFDSKKKETLRMPKDSNIEVRYVLECMCFVNV